jgi:integrase
MSLRNQKTPGSEVPVPSLTVELPKYVVRKDRADGSAFYFQVPRRLRPEGWPGAYRIPLAKEKRTGRADAAELATVTADAEDLYNRMKGEKEGSPDTTRLNTLPWLIASYEAKLKRRKKPPSPRTWRQYAYAAKQIKEWSAISGHPDVRQITRTAILEFVATMDATPTNRNHVAGYLHRLMKHACHLEIRETNPCVELELETPEAQVHIWEETEFETIMGAADADPYLVEVGTAVLIAYLEGPRPGDIQKFQRGKQYSPKDGALRYFQSKTKDNPHTNGWVTTPVNPRVRKRLAAQPATQLMLVVNKRTGKQYNERVFQRDFDRLREATGLHHLQFRHLRHTFVVNCKRAGLDAFEIASKTGHSQKSVEDMLRKHYLPHDSEVAANATRKIEEYRQRKAKERAEA